MKTTVNRGSPPLLLLLVLLPLTSSHNITQILSQFPQLSTFNQYLTLTHLSDEINRRETITVCAVNNSVMESLISHNSTPIATLKNILSLHVLLDYFDAQKLHQIQAGRRLAATLYQASGNAPGTTGMVNITVLKGGKVGFKDKDDSGPFPAVFVKSIKEIPYNISVIQISHIITSSDAAAPTPPPAEANLTEIMSWHGCKYFAEALAANSDALKTYRDSIEGGLTIFCALDDVFKIFLPRFKNLTANAKSSLLLYHGVPLYESMTMLKSNNGVLNTLATDGVRKKFDLAVQNDGDVVTLKTKIVTAKITGNVFDVLPLAIYAVDKVLLPKELFKADISPAPAPAPVPVPAISPEHSRESPPAPPTPDAPAADSPGDADAPADGPVGDEQLGDKNDAVGRREKGFWRFVMVPMGLGSVLVNLLL